MAQSSNASSLMLLLNNAKYNAGMQASTQATAALNSGVGALSKTLGTRLTATIGALALRRVAAGLRAIATDSIRAASDAREMGNQFNVVFSGVAASADRAFRKTADALGIAGSTAKTLLGDTGNLLVGFRFTERESLNLSQKVTKLAGDLTSLTNVQGGTSRATKLLVSGMLGHSRALKTLKISVNLAEAATKRQIKAIQVERGLRHEQARAIFVLNESIRQSPKALNDLKNTWNAFANTIRRISEQMKEVREIFGEMILRHSGLSLVVASLSRGLKQALTWWKSLGDQAKMVLSRFALVTAAAVILIGTLAGLSVLAPFFAAGLAAAVSMTVAFGVLALKVGVVVFALKEALQALGFLQGMTFGDIFAVMAAGAKRAFTSILGFILNLRENFGVLTTWILKNWETLWMDSKRLQGVVLGNMVFNMIIMGRKLIAVFKVITKRLAVMWDTDVSQSILKSFGKVLESMLGLAIKGGTAIADGFKKALAGGIANLVTEKFGKILGEALGVPKGGAKKGFFAEAREAFKKGGKFRLFEGFDGTKVKAPEFNLKIDLAKRKKLTDSDTDTAAKDLARVLTQSTAQRLTTSAREGTVGAANLTAQNRQRNQQISILEKISDNTAATNDKLDKAGLTPANLGT